MARPQRKHSGFQVLSLGELQNYVARKVEVGWSEGCVLRERERAEGRVGGTLAGPGWRWWRKGVGHSGVRDEESREVGGGRGQQDWEDPTERLDGQMEGWMEVRNDEKQGCE